MSCLNYRNGLLACGILSAPKVAALMSSTPHAFLQGALLLLHQYVGSRFPPSWMWVDFRTAFFNRRVSRKWRCVYRFQEYHGLRAPTPLLSEMSCHGGSAATLIPAGCEKPTRHGWALGMRRHVEKEKGQGVPGHQTCRKKPAPAASQAAIL